LDKDWMLNNFDEIESKVETLIKICESQEEANKNLDAKVTRLEQELQEKIEKENIYIEQKAIVRQRIDGLLMKLNDFSDYKE